MWDRALDYWRTLATDDDAAFDRDVALDCGALEPQITWGTDPSQVVGISGRVPESAGDRSEPARRGGKRVRLYGPQARNAARRPAGQSRLHRLLHQQPAAGPRSRRRRGARTARCRGRCRHGGARLVHREARGGGGRARSRVPRRRLLLGRIRLLDVRRRQRRPRRARRALRLDHQPQFRKSPGRRKCARILASPATAAATAIAGRIADVRQLLSGAA